MLKSVYILEDVLKKVMRGFEVYEAMVCAALSTEIHERRGYECNFGLT